MSMKRFFLSSLVLLLAASTADAQTREACCFADEGCRFLTAQDCVAQGGQPQGGFDCSFGATCCVTACCLPDDTCEELTLADCQLNRGGVWQGPGTTCATSDCVQGACCLQLSGLSCIIATEAFCSQFIGIFQGPGTTCETTDCSAVSAQTGACCAFDGTCVTLTAVDCFSQPGLFQGPGTDCATAACEPSEGCCLNFSSQSLCVELPPTICSAAGGFPQGPGTSCSSTTACCLPDGTCTQLANLDCFARGGFSQPCGQDCASTTCEPFEACCFADACVTTPPSLCRQQGGVPKGVGTSCASFQCPSGIGACCLSDGTCEQLSSADCRARPGDYQGEGSSCASCVSQNQACCFGEDPCAGAFCFVFDPNQCAALGGNPLGLGTTCEEGCPRTALEACCFSDGFCADIKPIDCLGSGGISQGPGSTCSTTTCTPPPVPLGACCFGPMACEIITEADCTGGGGTWLGANTGCPTQTFSQDFQEPGGEVFTHVIGVVVDCPVPTTRFRAARNFIAANGSKLDPWKSPASTDPGMMCHNFGVAASPAIPPDFFGVGSVAFTGSVCLEGVPLGTVDLTSAGFGMVAAGDADTLIKRSADPFSRCELPSSTEQTVNIEVVALSLRSIAPITVNFGDGSTMQFDVTVDLSPTPAAVGSLTAVKTHCNGGTYTSMLFVQPRFTFTNVNNTAEFFVLDTADAGTTAVMLDATSTPANWVADLHPSLGAQELVPTDFHPGVAESPGAIRIDCDCNNNDIRDACDFESGISLDCDRNLVPDECQDDSDADGVIDACDNCPNDNPDDSDGDGICDGSDLCPGFDDNVDADNDGKPDGCDNCPNDANPDQADGDGDGTGDACEPPPAGQPNPPPADLPDPPAGQPNADECGDGMCGMGMGMTMPLMLISLGWMRRRRMHVRER